MFLSDKLLDLKDTVERHVQGLASNDKCVSVNMERINHMQMRLIDRYKLHKAPPSV